MARSQEALEKRAEKRSIPIEEQRLKDSRKKGRKSEVVEKSSSVVKKVIVKKVVPVKDTNDWICTKCTNKNFHHRETCNRCQDSRDSQIIKTSEVVATPSPVEKTKIFPVVANQNWVCGSCKNDNFPSRTTCNRCQTDRIPAGSTGEKLKPAVKQIIASKPPVDRIAKGQGPISGKSLSWGKQATQKEIAENKRLLEAIKSEEIKGDLTTEELARAAILKERSIRKKEKKEQRIKWKAKKLSIKSGGAKVVKVASKIQKINQIRG